jgi:hypothetical protein
MGLAPGVFGRFKLAALSAATPYTFICLFVPRGTAALQGKTSPARGFSYNLQKQHDSNMLGAVSCAL